MNKEYNLESKLILIDKPIDWTSNDVVQYIKHLYNYKKVGHAGTLDLKATGLLILATNNKTKALNQLLHQDKTYELTLKFHYSSLSYDLDTNEVFVHYEPKITLNEINKAIKYFLDLKQYYQTPPNFSAKKIHGQKAYELARKNITFSLEPKLVQLYNIELISFDDLKQELSLIIDTSSGFYVRSFVNDFAKYLNLHAILIKLNRTRIGNFYLKNSIKIKKLK
ncbi:MAG: tRNA pseudouridine(55) synthase TruB [Mycoplasmataceae bacterium]|nr:tRNA pseudouridine(55) synthase TruB [Mycoplasmataceae bacterium]